MSASSRRVVISGIGALTPIGLDVHSYWQSLLEGRSGIRPIQSFDTSELPVQIGGELQNFDPKNHVDKKDRRGLKMMARTIQLGVAAAQLALDDGKVDKAKLDPTRFGVEFGAGLIATELPELADAAKVSQNCKPGSIDMEKWGDLGLEAVPPLWMLKYLPNMPACHVSILHNAQGPNNSITEGDAASLLALGEAYRILGRDGADFFLVGGAESKINPLSMVRQILYEPMSRRNDAPEKASRPFDKDRDGFVIGEGACVFVVEELEHAKRRNAQIYGEITGFASAFDRKLNGDGLARAIHGALSEAGIGPNDIDHVNAHGLGVQDADIWEARGMRQVFSGCKAPVPVFAAKSYIGNLGAGGSTTELAASLMAMRHGSLPGTLNYDEPDRECAIPVHTGKPRAVTKTHFVKISFTQMGQCAAVVVRKA
jgi:3-oxoacyl-[acyl-carrier-protein] synthase II